MRKLTMAAMLAVLSFGSVAAQAAEPESCKDVRFSDVGWTDITATTGTTSYILDSLGYKPTATLLSIPVTLESMRNKKIDIFLGDWEPTNAVNMKPYLEAKTVEVLGANLEGAKYTLAVPTYLYDQGLKSFKDIAKFKEQLGGKIYGIEPGNDGNQLILAMIKNNTDGVGGFKLVESSEQGMLAAVKKATAKKKAIVFLGWAPHPMNSQFKMSYLADGDDVFGPNFGGATVYTTARAGYVAECPNVGKLLTNLKFTLDMENDIMGSIMYDKADPKKAGAKWLKAHPEVLSTWLAGVTTIDGQPAEAAVKKSLGL